MRGKTGSDELVDIAIDQSFNGERSAILHGWRRRGRPPLQALSGKKRARWPARENRYQLSSR